MKLTRQERLLHAGIVTDRVQRERGIKELTSAALVEILGNVDPDVTSVAADELVRRGKSALDALIAGLSHHSGKVRATSALLMDHLADNRCIKPLYHAMRHDPLEAVRRCAMHSLVCDGCKDCPLDTDVVGALIEAALTDRSLAVKRRAVFYLGQQRPDARAVTILETLLTQESDPTLLRRARHALARQQSTN